MVNSHGPCHSSGGKEGRYTYHHLTCEENEIWEDKELFQGYQTN